LGEGEFVFDSDSPTDHEIEFTDEVKANVLRELSFKIEAGGATTYGKCEFDWKDSASSSDDYNVVFKGIGADTRADQSVVRLIFMNAENNGFIGAAKNVLITYSAEKGYRTVTVDFGEYKGSLPRENGIALPAKMKLYFDKKDAQNEYDVKATQNCVWNKDLVAD
jgi:hypothetical protein